MAREYGIDLPRAVEAGMSWRRLGVLVSGLSAESLYRFACRDGADSRPLRASDAASFFSSFGGGAS